MGSNQNVTYIIPAFNCANFLEDAVSSIYDDNFYPGDEVIICNDGSSDSTSKIMVKLSKHFEGIQLLSHKSNRGGGAARNTAACAASNHLIFCLDSDNILPRNSVGILKSYLKENDADMAAFANVHFFSESSKKIDKIITYTQSDNPLQDYLAKIDVPGGDGNYLFKKSAWSKVGGYPEFAHAMDTWGFGFRMAAEGFKSVLCQEGFYLHRVGHGSYWDRCKGLPISLVALQILLPYMGKIDERDMKYILKHPSSWYRCIESKPIKVKKHTIDHNSINRLSLSGIRSLMVNVKEMFQ